MTVTQLFKKLPAFYNMQINVLVLFNNINTRGPTFDLRGPDEYFLFMPTESC